VEGVAFSQSMEYQGLFMLRDTVVFQQQGRLALVIG
jgi:hypothetical protein